MDATFDSYGNFNVCGPPTAFFSVEAAKALGVQDNRQFLAFQKHLLQMQKYWKECNRKPRHTIILEGSHGIRETYRRCDK
jgi:hypothetical protein